MLNTKYSHLYSLYSDVITNIIMILIQAYGLFFLDWNGLYVTYLFCIDLLFMTVYTFVRNWQYNQLEEWTLFKKQRHYLFDSDKDVFVFLRVLMLAFYIFMIGVAAIPYENSYSINEYNQLSYTKQEVKSVGEFFASLFISDPVFIASASFIMLYYLKALFAKPDTSKEGMIEFSFNLASRDPRYLCPLVALFTIPIFLFFAFIFAAVVGYNYHKPTHSYLYVYAIWLLSIRFLINMLMIHTLKKEMNKKIEEHE